MTQILDKLLKRGSNTERVIVLDLIYQEMSLWDKINDALRRCPNVTATTVTDD